MGTVIEIGTRLVGPGHPCFIIAEAGVNHNGDVGLARQLVDTAVAAGADAVKFQAFRAERLASPTASRAEYQVENMGGDESQIDMLKRLELSDNEQRELQRHCIERGISFLSSPFDEERADFLETLSVGAYKIPSGEITNVAFLRHVAAKDKPLIVSTGMADLDEVREAVDAVRSAGNTNLVLLHCLSDYPADPAQANLRAMQTMADAFGVAVGFSDHTPGNEVSLAAVALGACVIEKHFTLDRTMPGPDHMASLEPSELATLISGIRTVESALGDGEKRPMSSEADTATFARKSLVAAIDLPVGATITREAVAIMRPGTGLPPSQMDSVVGKKIKIALSAGDLLTREALE